MDALQGRDQNNDSTEMCSGSETASYLRRIDSCITQLKAQGPSRTYEESHEEERIRTAMQAPRAPFLGERDRVRGREREREGGGHNRLRALGA